MTAPPQPTPDQEAPLIAAVLRWIRGLRAAVTVDEVESAVSVGSAVGLLALLSRAAQLVLNLMPVAIVSGEQAMAEVPDAARLNAVFNIVDPRFVTAVEQQGLTSVQGITLETRAALAKVISDAYRQGQHPRIIAPTIAETIGLTTRDAGAVTRKYTTMLEHGLRPGDAERKAKAYADKLTRQRAHTIARTETMKAHAIARHEAWMQAQRNGLFAGKRVYEEWLAVQTDPNEICYQMNGKTTPLGSTFDGLYPPQHPRCRCVTVPVFAPAPE